MPQYKNVLLTDRQGQTHGFRITYVPQGWRVVGKAIDEFVPCNAISLSTPIAIVNAAYKAKSDFWNKKRKETR